MHTWCFIIKFLLRFSFIHSLLKIEIPKTRSRRPNSIFLNLTTFRSRSVNPPTLLWEPKGTCYPHILDTKFFWDIATRYTANITIWHFYVNWCQTFIIYTKKDIYTLLAHDVILTSKQRWINAATFTCQNNVMYLPAFYSWCYFLGREASC